MTIIEQISADIKEAMKAKEAQRLGVLRMLNSAFKNRAIEEKKEELTDDEALKVIKSEVKKRKDSIQSYVEGGRDDLAQQEKDELAILENYLPEQMSEEQVREKISQVLEGLSPDQKDNFGAVMGAVMKEIGSQADGNTVRSLLQDMLK